ncbi:MAG: chemotaxis protein CheW [Hyphomicrobiaceae bacterium]|nr:chemotaxis protein CheW [Hyphomicrobiaceae bacterium]
MDDLLAEFLTETFENLEVVDSELVRFEREPNNADILGNVFRLVHTIKGTCGFLGLPRLEKLAHAAETLMGHYRDGAAVTDDGVTEILKSIDRIKSILAALEETQEEPGGDDQDLIDVLLLLAEVTGSISELPGADAADAALEVDEFPDEMPEAPAIVAAMDGAEGDEGEMDLSAGPMGRPLKPGEVSLAELEAAFANAEGPDLELLPKGDPVAETGQNAPAGGCSEKSVANQTIRVNVQTIEGLMNMVSELVLTRNQLLEISRRHADSEFNTPLQRLSNVTAELQEGVMQTRMQPIGNAWGKLPRIVRDLSHELGKPFDLQMSGAETELDRQVLELIRDPLTHMVRNSADHGIEAPEERRKAGKAETGTIRVSAFHEGGQIIIEIADDGKGLNTARLKEKALGKGIVSAAELDAMSDAQVHKLIFHPGFSTAEKVTSVSGRGVGMDVVRTNIELIGGSIDLQSVEGQGTIVRIKIPLTLAIIPALIIAAGGSRFAIPQLAVTELVRASAAGPNRIEMLKDAEVLRLRHTLLPIVRLKNLLRLQQEGGAPDASPKRSSSEFVVVIKVGAQTFGLVVDEVFHTEEIVVKPVSGMLKDVSMFSGNTIMGDGSVIMILDPNGVAQAVGPMRLDERNDAETPDSESDDARLSLLLFEAGGDGPKGVPLSLVTRLEEFDVSQIERNGNRMMVQYRGRLMPLVPVDEGMTPAESGQLPMLVFSEGQRSLGLVVDRIIDIVEDRLDLQVQSEREGFQGSAIIAGKATEIIDVGYFLPKAYADWFERRAQAGTAPARLLYAEDSAFFRNMIVPVLMGAGYELKVVEDGFDAYELIRAGERFDAIVTDIEMPNMDGFTLAKMVRDNPPTAQLPIIALSAFVGPEADARAAEIGINAYIAKFDRSRLIEIIRNEVRAGQMEIAA